jgi:hypothetical protein
MITLIVIGVIVLLGGGAALLLIPARNKMQSAAQRVQSQNNLKQMGIGIHSIASVYNGLEPPVVGQFPQNGYGGTFFFHLLPFIEQDNIYQSVTVAGPPPGSTASITGSNGFVKIYCGPGDPSNPGKNTLLTSYCVNGAIFGGQHGGTFRFPAMLTRGSANHILLFERYAVPNSTSREWTDQGPHRVWLYSAWDRNSFDAFPYAPNTVATSANTGFYDYTGSNGEVDFSNSPEKVSHADKPHAFSTTISALRGDGSTRSLDKSVNTTNVFLADGSSARTWGWACSAYGTMNMSPPPPGW